MVAHKQRKPAGELEYFVLCNGAIITQCTHISAILSKAAVGGKLACVIKAPAADAHYCS